MPEQTTRVIVKRSGPVCVIEFADRKILDELCIREIQDELEKLVSSEAGIRMLLSFGNVDHLSSAALGMLITLNKQVKDKGGKLKLSDIKPQIFEVFKITRLNKLFDIHDTADGAWKSF